MTAFTTSMNIMLGLWFILGCVKFNFGDFVCNNRAMRSSKTFYKDRICDRIGDAECLVEYTKCIDGQGLRLEYATSKCNPKFPKYNVTDMETLLCQVCENQENEGFDVLCCIHKYQIKDTGISPRQRDQIAVECGNSLPGYCQASLFRKINCLASNKL